MQAEKYRTCYLKLCTEYAIYQSNLKETTFTMLNYSKIGLIFQFTFIILNPGIFIEVQIGLLKSTFFCLITIMTYKSPIYQGLIVKMLLTIKLKKNSARLVKQLQNVMFLSQQASVVHVINYFTERLALIIT